MIRNRPVHSTLIDHLRGLNAPFDGCTLLASVVRINGASDAPRCGARSKLNWRQNAPRHLVLEPLSNDQLANGERQSRQPRDRKATPSTLTSSGYDLTGPPFCKLWLYSHRVTFASLNDVGFKTARYRDI
jgi:hypothetical protein